MRYSARSVSRPVRTKTFQSVAAVAVASFVMFFSVSLWSMLAPYAPSKLAVVTMRYMLFSFMMITYFYFCFIYRRPTWKGTRWQVVYGSLSGTARSWALVKLIVMALVFFGMVTWCMERWPAVPTKWLATTDVLIEARCVSADRWGKSHRRRVMIVTDSDEPLRFPWPEHLRRRVQAASS